MEKMELKSCKEWRICFIILFTMLGVGDVVFQRKKYGKRNYKCKDMFTKSLQLYCFFIDIDYDYDYDYDL